MNAREEILNRLRTALGPAPTAPRVPREYRVDDALDGPARIDLLVDRLVDYKAEVTRCRPDEVAASVATALAGVTRLVAPAETPESWLSAYPGKVVTDGPQPLSVAELDGAGAVLTGCAVAIAETGTIVLDGGPAQGRRALTLVPDHHVCVVTSDQVAGGVPAGLRRLTPTRPLTFISGPSATSDIELNRVEGVHGPRRLHVIVVEPG
ncbi:lactate utilization protein C [Planosporangium flavigriseum]|uniref:Lactate utilization protein C n=1 Tax=Planosporangium flavigriseum TaxID=373681 RepID=A0A8J3LPW7_9ACTN|nr:lactate utilization protein C [Planosporangium flavigriseum]NJC68027.1 lactate utilization protein C [Planosporangium flavigriseum]GIG76662.1 lactate utilization protein C [Planosporangium flavigriseum]